MIPFSPALLDEIETSADIEIPKDIIDQVIGQPNAVRKVKLAIKQHRHLLLVGPPGVGKSMLAQSLAIHLPKPLTHMDVCENPANQQKPFIELIKTENKKRIVNPEEVPSYVAEQLGFKCPICGTLSESTVNRCIKCQSDKFARITKRDEIRASHHGSDGADYVISYIRRGEQIEVEGDIPDAGLKNAKQRKKRTLIPVNRKTFVHATGASEVELLGDVRHDPYGMHPEIGTPAYLRVVPGAVHEAHEGVLFIDELPHLEKLQNYILTAMQEKKFPITGRNPQSGGASVKVEDVPCDFIFVGACNIKDVQNILSPLRSRILGNGYEILLETTMEDNNLNRAYLAQFISQEITKDGKIPHATKKSILALFDESTRRAKLIDDARNSLSLRLRDLGGVIRLAGDFAKDEESEFIEVKHINEAIEESKPIEYQLQERYGSVWKGIEKDQVINSEYGKTGTSYL